MNRQHFRPPFSTTSVPPWGCPACVEGGLTIVMNTLRIEETTISRKSQSDPDWEPNWTRQQFSILLRCNRCEEPVFSIGSTMLMEVEDEDYRQRQVEALVPKFFVSAVPMITSPKSCPVEISAEVLNASSLYWTSPPSAGNLFVSAWSGSWII